jgi:hypothetical protein
MNEVGTRPCVDPDRGVVYVRRRFVRIGSGGFPDGFPMEQTGHLTATGGVSQTPNPLEEPE